MFRCAAVIVCLVAILSSAVTRRSTSAGTRSTTTASISACSRPSISTSTTTPRKGRGRHAARLAERWYARLAHARHTFTRTAAAGSLRQPPLSADERDARGTLAGDWRAHRRNKSRIAMPFAHRPRRNRSRARTRDRACVPDRHRQTRRADAFAFPVVHRRHGRGPVAGPPDAQTHVGSRCSHHERLPTMEQLDEPRYSPYRFGHAFWSYLAPLRRRVFGRALRSKSVAVSDSSRRRGRRRGVDRSWHESIDRSRRSGQRGVRRRIAVAARRCPRAPRAGPESRRPLVMFVSERDRLSLDLFMADAATGQSFARLSARPPTRTSTACRTSIRPARGISRAALRDGRAEQRQAGARHPGRRATR